MTNNYSITEKNEIQILKVKSLFGQIENKNILNKATTLIEKGFANFVVDFSEMNIMNSVGLSFLINLMKRVNEAGGKLALTNANETIMKLLEVTKVRPMFHLFPTVNEAVNFITTNK